MLLVGIFPIPGVEKRLPIYLPIFSGQVWCMAFAKACQAAGGQRHVFSANFLPPKREGFHGTTGTPAGGQGSSRKHCAIAFRAATKRPLENLRFRTASCWLGGDGGDFEIFLCLCSVLFCEIPFKPRIFHLFPKRINFNHGFNWLKLSRRRPADGSWVGQKAAAVVAFLASMAGLVHLVLRALSPDPRPFFRLKIYGDSNPKRSRKWIHTSMNIELYITHTSYMMSILCTFCLYSEV